MFAWILCWHIATFLSMELPTTIDQRNSVKPSAGMHFAFAPLCALMKHSKIELCSWNTAQQNH